MPSALPDLCSFPRRAPRDPTWLRRVGLSVPATSYLVFF
jgi:hypothetical protein